MTMNNKLLNQTINLIQSTLSNYDNKPSYFNMTHYKLPTKEQIKQFQNYPNLTAKQIQRGIGYTIVGRGLSTNKTKQLELEACQLLIDSYPDRQQYKQAYKLLNMQQPRFK